jgi:hypothetical protein
MDLWFKPQLECIVLFVAEKHLYYSSTNSSHLLSRMNKLFAKCFMFIFDTSKHAPFEGSVITSIL